MLKNSNSKPYDLEERTFQFAKDVMMFMNDLKKTITRISAPKRVGFM